MTPSMNEVREAIERIKAGALCSGYPRDLQDALKIVLTFAQTLLDAEGEFPKKVGHAKHCTISEPGSKCNCLYPPEKNDIIDQCIFTHLSIMMKKDEEIKEIKKDADALYKLWNSCEVMIKKRDLEISDLKRKLEKDVRISVPVTVNEIMGVIKKIPHAMKLDNALIGIPPEIDWDWEYANFACAISEYVNSKLEERRVLEIEKIAEIIGDVEYNLLGSGKNRGYCHEKCATAIVDYLQKGEK